MDATYESRADLSQDGPVEAGANCADMPIYLMALLVMSAAAMAAGVDLVFRGAVRLKRIALGENGTTTPAACWRDSNRQPSRSVIEWR
jgi:hypothetical protein